MCGSGFADDESRRKRGRFRRVWGRWSGGVRIMSCLRGVRNAPDVVDLEVLAVPEAKKQQRKESMPPTASKCSICLDLVVECGKRSIAKLHCGHEFHLDCIGSAFNAKGAMQCPICRQVEKGRWLFANGHRFPSEFGLEGWIPEDMLDVNYPELPFGIRWCPYRGFPQSASLFDEGEFHPNSYHDLTGSTFVVPSSASSSFHACPYLAMYGSHLAMPSAAPTNPDAVPESARFPRNAPNLGAQSSDLVSFHGYQIIEPHNRNWPQQTSHPFAAVSNYEQLATQIASRLSRNDGGVNQQRLGAASLPHLFLHGSARTRSNLLASSGTPVMGEARGHAHGGRIYQQPVPPVFHGNSHFPLWTTSGPRAGVTSTPMAAPPSSASGDVGGGVGFYGVSGSAVRRARDGENVVGRHFDRTYGCPGRESFPPLQWSQVEGELRWRDPFDPTSRGLEQGGGMNDYVTRNFFPQRPYPERTAQSRPNSGHLRAPQALMPPFW